MKPLNELLLDAPRLGDKYGVNLRARLTDEWLEELFDGAELSRDELVLLRVLGDAIYGGGVIREPMRAGRYHSVKTPGDPESTYAEDLLWWKLLAQHLPPQATSPMVPTLHKVTAEKYSTVDRGRHR